MEIRRYTAILNRRKWVIILTAVVTLAVVALGSYRMTPTYSASSMVRIGQVGNPTYTDLNYTERLMQTYVQLLKSRPILEEVIGRLGLAVGPKELSAAFKVEAIANTELIRVTVERADPRQAAAIANQLAVLLTEQGQKTYSGEGKSAREILLEQVTTLEGQLAEDRARLASQADMETVPDPSAGGPAGDLAAKIRVEQTTYETLLGQYEKARLDEALRANSIGVVEPAVVPSQPSKPNRKLNLALGVLVGLIGGVGLAFLFENLDPALHSSDDLVSVVTVPLLGRIPRFKTRNRSQSGEIVLGNSFSPSATEAFLGLSVNVLSLNSGACPKTILISSAEPRAGKSTVLLHLGAALAQAGRQVIVVDGDLRDPSLHHLLGLSKAPGLADVVLDPSVLDYTLRETQIQGLRALTAGRPQTNPVGFWRLPGVPEVIGKLAEAADVVLWDSPPVLVAADAALLARMLDGVLLVVAHDQTAAKQVNLALAQLGQVEATVVGTVYNRCSEDILDYYDYPHGGAKPAKGPTNEPRQAKTKRMSPVSRQSTA
jgi:polysaccharide biosynthesis transport protein